MDRETEIHNYFEAAKTKPRKIEELSDMEFAYHLSKVAGNHAFFTLVEGDYKENRGYPVVQFSMQQLFAEANVRVKSKRSLTENFLASKLKAAISVTIVSCDMYMEMPAQDRHEVVKMSRGMYDVVDTKVREATVAAAIIVLTAKPEIRKSEKNVVTMAPVTTDTKGALYPLYKALPPNVVNCYATSKNVPEVFSKIVQLLVKTDDMPVHVMMNTLVPFLSHSSTGGEHQKSFTRVHAPASKERAHHYDSAGLRVPRDDTGRYLVKSYAPPPSLKGDYNLMAAYTYLTTSRAIRGEGGGGITGLTALYYHGDVPIGFWRAYSLAYNILSVYTNSTVDRKEVGGYPMISPKATILETTTISESVNGMLRLNRPTMSLTAYTYSRTPNYGLQQLGAGPFVAFHAIQRSFSLNKKNVLTFEKSFPLVRDQIEGTVSTYNNNLKGAEIHHFFHVIACESILACCTIVPSAHPHPGFVWVYVKPHAVMGKQFLRATLQPPALKKVEKAFATRMILANSYKNYYPFHRVPFVKCDLAIPQRPSVILMRRTAKPSESVMFKYAFSESDANPEVNDQQLDEEKEQAYLSSMETYKKMQEEKLVEAQQVMNLDTVEVLTDYFEVNKMENMYPVPEVDLSAEVQDDVF